jgi:23S rRNA (adenine2030-N6)-methyltransferase
MLSYRHAFHAGNHADILKHYTFGLVLEYFNQKEKPYCVIDTHAGAGMYALQSEFSQKNKEFQTGISRLLNTHSLPETLLRFTAMVNAFNKEKSATFYPGSPKIAEYHQRQNDQLRLFELHPNEYQILLANFSQANRKQTKIMPLDGFRGIKAHLPPSTKRGIIIIDPPYEEKEDYLRVLNCIKDSLRRFATGTYLIWYPLLQRAEPKQMITALQELHIDNWLNVSITVSQPTQNGLGMFGSGLYIINPPWTLPHLLEESLPYLARLLGQDETVSTQLTFSIA